jgi:PHP family Zn ribbon phosphoesterase
MELNLTCGQCGTSWTVERWTPTAMACPKCGSAQLGDGRSRTEEQLRIAKKKAAQQRKRLEHSAHRPTPRRDT